MIPRFALPALAALVLSCSGARAAEDCFVPDDLSTLTAVMKVAGDGRAAFGASPDKAGACAGKCPFVLPGDVVAAAETKVGATCVVFNAASGKQTSGWLPASRLAPWTPQPADWAGYWGDKDRSVSIRLDGGDLVIEAKMTYQGGGPVFSGAFKGRAKPAGAVLTLANDARGRQIDPAKARDGACKVTLALAGAGLLVHDENCVGAGSPANFDGAYFRRRS